MPNPTGESVDAPPTIALSAVAGAPWQGPLFSIILSCQTPMPAAGTTADEHVGGVILEGRPPQTPPFSIVQSLRRQTYRSFELVLWDAATGLAWTLDAPDQPWRVARPADLGPTLLGKYACVASPAFAALPATLLEVNAIALESQELDITVNDLGEPKRTLMIGRAEALAEDLAFSLDQLAPRAHMAHIAGRLLPHSPATEDRGLKIEDSFVPAPEKLSSILYPLSSDHAWGALPASSRWQVTTLGNQLLVRVAGQAGWGPVPQTLRLVDSVVRATAAPGDKPRILVVFPFIAVGGAEKLTLDVLTRLKQRFELLVVALEPHDPATGSMVAEFQELTPYVYLLPDFLPPQLTFSALCYLIDGYRVQTLFVANGAGWIYDAAASLRDRFPHLHMVNQVYDHRVGWIDRYDSALARVFDRHIAPNQAIVGAYRERGVPPAKIDLIYHGTDLAAFDPGAYDAARIAELRSRFGLPAGLPVVAFLARMHPQKRPLDFLMLARRFRPTEACFLMVGDGPLRAQIDDQLARAKLAHLHRLPFYKPLRDMLAVVDVVVIPSEYEGLPLVLLEAQALGKPVVATDVGAIREALEYTGGGVVVARVGDQDALERGVRAMLARPPDAARMRERLRERFDIEQVAARYGDALTSLDS